MCPQPLISIIIPHYRGKEILCDCLQSVRKTRYKNREVILVDNATVDGSLQGIEDDYPEIKLVRNSENLGYAGGCNSGLSHAAGEYVVFLNDDTVVSASWLEHLVAPCEQDRTVAAVQPKILSLQQPGYFDYAGGAGGLLDRFGYPFAKGRIFFTLEADKGQYDDGGDIFWASGTAMLVRKSVLEQVGTFDEDFFAHMEEIDLNWRIHLAGYRVVSAPKSIVQHRAGSTLTPDSPQKLFLNHRNSLYMLIKNYELKNLLWIFPLRVALEGVTMVYALLKRDLTRFRAAATALFAVLTHFPRVARKRSHVRNIRKVSDHTIFEKMYGGSIVLDYFVRRMTTVSRLHV